jgi:prepilin-type N-terminal cleavage/methylation domain-containing protein
MKFRSRYLQGNGFTLTEVLIALAIFAGMALVLMMLFPVARNTEQQSGRETRATLIAESIMEALAMAHDSGTLRVATALTNGMPCWTLIDPSRGTNIIVSYNASCEPLSRLEARSAASPLSDKRAVAVATLTFTPNQSASGLINAEVAISSPASAPAEHRSTNRFTRLLVTP